MPTSISTTNIRKIKLMHMIKRFTIPDIDVIQTDPDTLTKLKLEYLDKLVPSAEWFRFEGIQLSNDWGSESWYRDLNTERIFWIVEKNGLKYIGGGEYIPVVGKKGEIIIYEAVENEEIEEDN